MPPKSKKTESIKTASKRGNKATTPSTQLEAPIQTATKRPSRAETRASGTTNPRATRSRTRSMSTTQTHGGIGGIPPPAAPNDPEQVLRHQQNMFNTSTHQALDVDMTITGEDPTLQTERPIFNPQNNRLSVIVEQTETSTLLNADVEMKDAIDPVNKDSNPNTEYDEWGLARPLKSPTVYKSSEADYDDPLLVGHETNTRWQASHGRMMDRRTHPGNILHQVYKDDEAEKDEQMANEMDWIMNHVKLTMHDRKGSATTEDQNAEVDDIRTKGVAAIRQPTNGNHMNVEEFQEYGTNLRDTRKGPPKKAEEPLRLKLGQGNKALFKAALTITAAPGKNLRGITTSSAENHNTDTDALAEARPRLDLYHGGKKRKATEQPESFTGLAKKPKKTTIAVLTKETFGPGTVVQATAEAGFDVDNAASKISNTLAISNTTVNQAAQQLSQAHAPNEQTSGVRPSKAVLPAAAGVKSAQNVRRSERNRRDPSESPLLELETPKRTPRKAQQSKAKAVPKLQKNKGKQPTLAMSQNSGDEDINGSSISPEASETAAETGVRARVTAAEPDPDLGYRSQAMYMNDDDWSKKRPDNELQPHERLRKQQNLENRLKANDSLLESEQKPTEVDEKILATWERWQKLKKDRREVEDDADQRLVQAEQARHVYEEKMKAEVEKRGTIKRESAARVKAIEDESQAKIAQIETETKANEAKLAQLESGKTTKEEVVALKARLEKLEQALAGNTR